jgi:aminoglycoside phosphotransferase
LDVWHPCWVVQLLLGQLRSLHDQGAELCPFQQR